MRVSNIADSTPVFAVMKENDRRKERRKREERAETGFRDRIQCIKVNVWSVNICKV